MRESRETFEDNNQGLFSNLATSARSLESPLFYKESQFFMALPRAHSRKVIQLLNIF